MAFGPGTQELEYGSGGGVQPAAVDLRALSCGGAARSAKLVPGRRVVRAAVPSGAVPTSRAVFINASTEQGGVTVWVA